MRSTQNPIYRNIKLIKHHLPCICYTKTLWVSLSFGTDKSVPVNTLGDLLSNSSGIDPIVSKWTKSNCTSSLLAGRQVHVSVEQLNSNICIFSTPEMLKRRNFYLPKILICAKILAF